MCGDSHTSTHGAFGAYAFGIGASEVAHVLMTQTLWQKKPRRMRISVDGALSPGITAKDIALTIIARIGADGAQGHAIEYAGSAVRGLSMEGRMTLCNLSIEAGARLGHGRARRDDLRLAARPALCTGRGRISSARSSDWRALASDDDAVFDREVSTLRQRDRADGHMGHQPRARRADHGRVPDPDRIADPARAQAVRDALAYMGLARA